MAVKTPDQVKREFRANGVTISRWAEEHSLSVRVVYQVLSGGRKGVRGQTHQAMVLLGMKAKAGGGIAHANSQGVKA